MTQDDDVGSTKTLLWIGRSLVALAAMHNLATLGGGGHALLAMARAGWWNSAGNGAGQNFFHVAVFWSLWFGSVLGLLGWAVIRSARGKPVVGRALGVTFALMSLVGALAVPAGGFWLAVGVGVWIAVSAQAAVSSGRA